MYSSRPGPQADREKLVVLGKYLDDALLLANMSQSDLARAAGLRSSSYVSRVMKGKSVDREVLLQWITILKCPTWLEEKIMNAAGYASEQQRQATEAAEVIEMTHRAVLEEVERRGKE